MDPQALILQKKLCLGLCCINTVLRKQQIYCSRTCIRRNFTVKLAQERALQNINDLFKLIEWNKQNNINCFRISSDLFPHFTDTETEPYTIDFARPLLKKFGELINLYQHRIIMHPGQFNQIGSPNETVFVKTVADLTHHANILDAMGIDDNGVLIVHIGGTYGDKPKTIQRWIQQFYTLPNMVKRRLVIENCEKNYSVMDCIGISNKCGIPVVFDIHHYNCWGSPQLSITELMPLIINTWKTSGRRIVMHISEQAPNKRLGAHSDYVEKIPNEIFDAINRYNINIDLEIEAKMKEQAVLKLYNKYVHPIKKIKVTLKTVAS